GLVCSFFFQAEDGIRDLTVTGVQTCALPISNMSTATTLQTSRGPLPVHISGVIYAIHREGNAFFDANMPRRPNDLERLAESGDQIGKRRVGKECRYGWSASHDKKRNKR